MISLPTLNFPKYSFRLKDKEEKTYIFDSIRRIYVLLQPEEWVRQHLISYLIRDKNIPHSSINVEKQIKIGKVCKRYDAIVYAPDGNILLTIECKAPSVAIGQDTFNQLAQYNMTLQSKYLMITNGLQHHVFRTDNTCERYSFLMDLPEYHKLVTTSS